MSLIRIEPLGTNVVLPALMVGYDITDFDQESLAEKLADEDWLLILDQQAGGMAMSYPSVVGTLLRFTANADHSVSSIDPMLRAFGYMAEDPQIGRIRKEFPTLVDLAATPGIEYTREQLRRLDQFLGRFYQLPSLGSGIEAFVQFEKCNPLQYVSGWKVMTGRLREATERRGSPYRYLEPFYYIDDSNLADLMISDDSSYSQEVQQQLVELSAVVGGVEPQMFLLWENAD